MGAGQPDWARLHAMGKLPKNGRPFVQGLEQSDKKDKELEELKEQVKILKSILRKHKIDLKEELKEQEPQEQQSKE